MALASRKRGQGEEGLSPRFPIVKKKDKKSSSSSRGEGSRNAIGMVHSLCLEWDTMHSR